MPGPACRTRPAGSWSPTPTRPKVAVPSRFVPMRNAAESPYRYMIVRGAVEGLSRSRTTARCLWGIVHSHVASPASRRRPTSAWPSTRTACTWSARSRRPTHGARLVDARGHRAGGSPHHRLIALVSGLRGPLRRGRRSLVAPQVARHERQVVLQGGCRYQGISKAHACQPTDPATAFRYGFVDGDLVNRVEQAGDSRFSRAAGGVQLGAGQRRHVDLVVTRIEPTLTTQVVREDVGVNEDPCRAPTHRRRSRRVPARRRRSRPTPA